MVAGTLSLIETKRDLRLMFMSEWAGLKRVERYGKPLKCQEALSFQEIIF